MRDFHIEPRHVYVLTVAEATEKYKLRREDLLILTPYESSDGCRLCCPLTAFDWHDLAALAGFDPVKIDWAVPQEFFDAHAKEFEGGHGYCWYYGKPNELYGEPLGKDKIKHMAAQSILRKFYEDVFGWWPEKESN
jgi:hypothetical protein